MVLLDDLLQLELPVVLAERELAEGRAVRRVSAVALESHLAAPDISLGARQLRSRLWEAFHAAFAHQLGHFLRHVALVLYQNVLVFDVELAELEVEHFHDLLQVVVAGLDYLLGLGQPKLDDMEILSV